MAVFSRRYFSGFRHYRRCVEYLNLGGGVGFVVIGIVDAFHEHLAVVDFVGQRGFEQRFQGRAVDDAPAHGVEIRLFIDLAPVDALLQTALEHQIKPDAGAASVALHEGVGDVHFHIFVDYLVEAGLRHTLDGG